MTKRIYWGKIRGNLKGNLRGFLKEEEKCQEGKKQKTGFDFFVHDPMPKNKANLNCSINWLGIEKAARILEKTLF